MARAKSERTAAPKPPGGRLYSGLSPEDRQAERRQRLVRAAAVVAGRRGLEGTTVAAICAEAGLTARYFYESFPNREAIFVDAYRLARDELLRRMGEGGGRGTKAALTAFYSALQAHPGLARVFLVDIDDHGPVMKAISAEGGAMLTKAFGLRPAHPLQQAGQVGAIVDIGKRWIESGFAEPVEKVVSIALSFARLKP